MYDYPRIPSSLEEGGEVELGRVGSMIVSMEEEEGVEADSETLEKRNQCSSKVTSRDI